MSSFASDLVGRQFKLKACKDNPHLNTEKHCTVTGGDRDFTYVQWDDGIRQQFINTEFHDSLQLRGNDED
jgi:hypothetical protein